MNSPNLPIRLLAPTFAVFSFVSLIISALRLPGWSGGYAPIPGIPGAYLTFGMVPLPPYARNWFYFGLAVLSAFLAYGTWKRQHTAWIGVFVLAALSYVNVILAAPVFVGPAVDVRPERLLHRVFLVLMIPFLACWCYWWYLRREWFEGGSTKRDKDCQSRHIA